MNVFFRVNPRLALIGFPTTGPIILREINSIYIDVCGMFVATKTIFITSPSSAQGSLFLDVRAHGTKPRPGQDPGNEVARDHAFDICLNIKRKEQIKKRI